MPTWDDGPSLPYVRSLIKEVHRYNPIASLGSSESVEFPQTSSKARSLYNHNAKSMTIKEYHIVL